MTSSPLFSSSGCAVAIMKMPAFPRWRSARPSAACPWSSSMGVTRICAVGTGMPTHPTASRTNRRRLMIPSSWLWEPAMHARPGGSEGLRGGPPCGAVRACPASRARPALPVCLERHLEPDLRDALIVGGGTAEREARLLGGRRVADVDQRIASRVGCDHPVHASDVRVVEEVLGLDEHLRLRATRYRNEA